MIIALLIVVTPILLAFKKKWIQISSSINYDEVDKYIEVKVAEEIKKNTNL